MPAPSIADNFARVREHIARAAERSRRRVEEITVVAVSKTFPAEAIRAAHAAGLRHFGENRVQEWEGKQAHLGSLDDATWHLIGHLQSNKARRAVRLFHTVDSVDSMELAQKLDSAAAELNKRLRVLIEVRLDPAASKTGVAEADAPKLMQAILKLAHLDLRGLMGIPPYFEDVEKVRPYFRRLRDLRSNLRLSLRHALPELSMGMSHDFEVAVEEGATQLRLGTALFGERALAK
ncbi:MAG TPA: YggS family pyridoxal phosphate-dependent enzyme [Candidatus Acidoferrales bacterium]|nr:YggS family pyridoxal phosphate-dependent enzyme [Candidatus Acidoferrales bacterium]